MSGEMIKLADLGIKPREEVTKSVESLAGSADYLPRIQMLSGRSNIVAEGKFPANHYAMISGDTYIDLGENPTFFILDCHPKALDMSDTDNIVAIYDDKDPKFQEIADRSFGQDSGCVYGPEYLAYDPQTQKFATFMFGSKSARNVVGQVHQLFKQEKPVQFGSKFVKKGKFPFQAITAEEGAMTFDSPTKEDCVKAIEKFRKMEDVVIPEAAKTDTKARKR